MPSEEQLVEIYRASGKGLSRDEVVARTGAGLRTVDRALQLQREHKDGLDLCGGATRSGWKLPSVKNAILALEFLHAEQIESSARPGIVRQVASELSKSLGVPVTRDVLGPKSEVWIGHGLIGSITLEPQLRIEGENEWRIFNADMPEKLRKSFENFRKSLMSYGRSIKEMHRVCSSQLPGELDDPSIVRNPDLAKEAAVVSMLSWLRQPQRKGITYSTFARREFLPKSKGTTTVSLGGWMIETRNKDADAELFIDLLESSEIILESREAERFKNNYKNACDVTKALCSDLFDLSVS